ncbi:glycoside hydrolase family 1 [Fusarium coicis]|nr:glycoside hydrolase family 1 [Fusarium coicis]
MSYSTIAQDPAYENVLPENFISGYSSASYQIEGGAAEGGRGPSIWDKHLHETNKDHGDVACDSYHLWQKDVDLLKQYKAQGYRFSVSWSRVIPKGGRNDPINEQGIKYYNDLAVVFRTQINALLAANIEPTITLLHFDVPLGIDERYNSFLATDPKELIADYTFFSKLCFERFGDRVKKWLTFNEPWIFPSLLSMGMVKDFSKKEFFRVGHNILLCHADIVRLYRSEFQKEQKGLISIALNSEWVEPLNDTPEAIREAKLSIERTFGWFANPIFLGTQTTSWDQYGDDFPRLSDSELASLKGSADFLSLNHYGTTYATGLPVQPNGDPRFNMDDVDKVWEKDGVKIGKRGEEGHPHIVPWGFRKLLVHTWETYCKAQNIPIVISECGFSVEHEQHMSLEQIVDDKDRQEYLNLYIKALCDASKEDGVLVTGFYTWSLLDNLEWLSGYGPRFGVTHVDRENGCKRTPKNSTKMLAAIWQHTTKGQ